MGARWIINGLLNAVASISEVPGGSSTENGEMRLDEGIWSKIEFRGCGS